MEERRRARRHARQLAVHFGVKGKRGFPGAGLTHDVSASGLFVLSKLSYLPGTRLHLEVTLGDEQPLYVEGIVARQVYAPTDPTQGVGFGVRYLAGAELVDSLVPSPELPASNEDPYTLTFDGARDWRSVWDQDLRSGVCFLWAREAPSLNTLVGINIELRHLRRRFSFPARVVHTMRGPDGRHGVALMFVDVSAATTALAATIAA